jgi:hypothetical protein
MRRFVEGVDREQATLFPECLQDWIDQDSPVRAIDAFVDKLELSGLGFDGVAPEATGALKPRCTSGKERRITRWEHEHVLEAVQSRLDRNPQAMRQRRETVEHPFGTLKMRMGATHFLMKRLPKVATEMALHVLAYNLTRVMNILGIQPLMAAIRA